MRYVNVLRDKLHQELLEAGIIPVLVRGIDGNLDIGADITFADGTDMTLVQSIIDAHNSTPIPPALSIEDQLRLEMARSNAEMFETMLTLLGGM